MTLLEEVLGENLAKACFEEIMRRSHPADSYELTQLLRTEIILKFCELGGVTLDTIKDIVFTMEDGELLPNWGDETDAVNIENRRYIIGHLTRVMDDFDFKERDFLKTIVVGTLCEEMTPPPRIEADGLRLTERYERYQEKLT